MTAARWRASPPCKRQALAREQAALEALRRPYEAAQTLEASARQITAQRLQLQQAVTRSISDERAEQTSEATSLLSRTPQRRMAKTRGVSRESRPGPAAYRSDPTSTAMSAAIGNMVIFCFDLTIAVLAHRHGRGPDS